MTLLPRLLAEDDGQDLIEYALLTALVGIAALAVWQQLRDAVGVAYGSAVDADGTVQELSACTPDPGGAGCGA